MSVLITFQAKLAPNSAQVEDKSQPSARLHEILVVFQHGDIDFQPMCVAI